MVPALIFLSAFAVYVRLMAPGIALEDSGEFATAAVTLTLTHPPGYPFYLVVGKLFSLLPLGSPAIRLGVLSSAAAAGAAVLLYHAVLRVAGREHRTAAAAAALAFACARSLAIQSAICDKYALNSLLLGAVLVLLLDGWRSGSRTSLAALGLAGGVAAAHHMMVLYAAPAILGILWRERAPERRRHVAVFILFLALGSSLRPVVPALVSLHSPSLMYDRLDRAGKLYGYLAARAYGDRFSAYSPAVRARRVLTHGLGTVAADAWPALLLLPLGLAAAWRNARPLLAAGGAAGLLALALVSNMQIQGVGYYMLPVTALVLLLGGMGLARLRSRLGRAAEAAAGILLVALTARQGLPPAGVARYFGAHDWGRNLLSSCDRDTVLVTLHDDDFYPPMYLTRVLEERPDVIIVHRPMLTRRWYHYQVQRLHPGFEFLNPLLIPWNTTVTPDALINLFLRSHVGERELAFTYLATAETAGGFTLLPDGCVYRTGRAETSPAPLRAAAFSARFRRFRLRSAFAEEPDRDFRFRDVAGAYSTLWIQNAVCWVQRDNNAEARECLRQGLRFPYTRVVARDVEKMRRFLGI